MKFNLKVVLFLLPLICLILKGFGQTSFYDITAIQKIEIHFNQTNWDYQLDTAKNGSEGYVQAEWIKLNGTQINTVGVKYKGNSSYDSVYPKNPIHIELDTYIDQNYQGFKDIKLSNAYSDPSMIREVLAYDILGNYMDCPGANFAQVYINDVYFGVYTNTESVNKKFLSDHFFTNDNTFIKCNPNVIPGLTTKCNLKYINADSSSYFNYYEIKSDYGWNDLVKLCDTITNHSSQMHNSVDIDRAIWMLAFNNVLINLDSYSGAFVQNYYLYKDETKRFSPIVWDLNMSFGGFPFVGSGASSLGTLTLANMQQLPITIHGTDSYWPLIKNIIGNAQYKRMYMAHLRTITNEIFVSNSYQNIATQLQTVVDTAVFSDTCKFYTYADFQNGMTANVNVGNYSVPGISTLMSARKSYIMGTTDYNYSAPVITNVLASNNSPSINSIVYFTATITNSTTVYFAFRNSPLDKFEKYLMYDDGMHNDGVAGDNLFGVDLTMTSTFIQYYIYAENTLAGKFSPERAEHEFYSLYGRPVPAPGDIVINEFLADNQEDTRNEYNIYEDWIELYNTTSNEFVVSDLYLTDDYSNRTKYNLPSGFTIQPHSYLIVWADQYITTSSYIHANFKLSNNGESIMLSNVFGEVLDSVTYGEQLGDVSWGKCPNGSGPYQELPYPTFITSNCASTGIAENSEIDKIRVYPNPASDKLTILSSGNSSKKFEILNVIGQIVFEDKMEKSKVISLESFAAGIYFVKVGNAIKKVIISK